MPVDHRVGVVADGFQAPRRYELGDNDISAWEADAKGEVKDPWQKIAWLVVIASETKDVFTLLASSKGALDAVAELSRAHSKEARKKPGVLPLVSLEVDAYQHPDRKIGRVKFPVLNIIEYVAAARLERLPDDAPAAAPERPKASITFDKRVPDQPPPIDADPSADLEPIDDDIQF